MDGRPVHLAAATDPLATAVAAHDRKLAVLAAQTRLLSGAMGLLVTVLIAVY